MSDYFLIKRYNPAYRHWIRAFLKEKKLMGDRDYSWKEAQYMSMDMAKRGVHDDFFQGYFWAWANHEDYQPDYFYLLRQVLPTIYKDGKLDLKEIRRLDSEARDRGQRITFTLDDAARDFHDFYDKCLIEPLARELEGGSGRAQLLGFFEFEEDKKIPDNRVHSPEKVDEVVHEIATGLLRDLRMITSEKILEDIKWTLDGHYDKGIAVARPNAGYDYKSKYVHISTYREKGLNGPVATLLMPARGYGAVKEGYRAIYYPWYYVEALPNE